MGTITYEQIKCNAEIRTLIEKGDELIGTMGITEHATVHADRVAETAADILHKLGYSRREIELAKIAAYMHDIGNLVNRTAHAQSGAIMAYTILSRLGMDTAEIVAIVAAIGNHDENNGSAVNPLAAALMLADKSDVRRSRVRNTDIATFDIHDRVNYAVEQSTIYVDADSKIIALHLSIDTTISSKMEYFEIFLTRMMMCRKAAAFLGGTFELYMNTTKLL